MAETLLEIKNLSLRIKKKQILKNINITFEAGEAVLIAGKNGSGKSTFLKCLAGILLPDSGQINSIVLNPRHRGFISDKMSLLENYTLQEGINFHCRVFAVNNFKANLIEELNLDLNKKIKDLSAGERAIFHLSLLISQEPELLIIDEIIHTIDPYLREIFLEKLIELMDEFNTTVIMVNHTFSDTGRIPERILLMEEGQFILDEKREELGQKIRKVVSKEPLKENLPVIFKKESSVRNEYYIYPFSEDLGSKTNHDFLSIDLSEIIKAFIGGYYDQKRIL